MTLTFFFKVAGLGCVEHGIARVAWLFEDFAFAGFRAVFLCPMSWTVAHEAGTCEAQGKAQGCYCFFHNLDFGLFGCPCGLSAETGVVSYPDYGACLLCCVSAIRRNAISGKKGINTGYWE